MTERGRRTDRAGQTSECVSSSRERERERKRDRDRDRDREREREPERAVEGDNPSP